MPISEITNAEEAERRLKLFFPDIPHGVYVELLDLLCDTGRFTKGLEAVSSMIWDAYNAPENLNVPNRFTRSIVSVANKTFGFTCQDNVVLTAPADSKAFGQRIRDRVLWKDSFAAGHGEFAHSYQWLVAGHVLGWGPYTGRIYAYTAGKRSAVPLYVRDTGGMVMRGAQLWEYLVDCTLYKPVAFDSEADKATEDWVKRQLENWAGNKLTSTWFIDAFLRGPTSETKDPLVADLFKVGFQDKKNYETWEKRRGKSPETLLNDVRKLSDIAGFTRLLREQFPVRNALTATTFRSANNVTTLSSASDWFISVYDNHRTMALLRKQNERLRQRAIEQLGAVGLTQAFFERNHPTLRRMFEAMVEQLLDEGVNANFKQGETKVDPLSGGGYHAALVKAARNAARTLGYSIEQVKSAENLIQRTLHPIQVRKQERKDHYMQHTGFTAAKDDSTIFHRRMSTQPKITKTTMPAEFHHKQGTLNQGVYASQLMK